MSTASLAMFAQQASVDLAVTYTAVRSLKAASTENFWAQGGTIELGATAWKGLGIAAVVSGVHAKSIGSSGIPISFVTATFGPRYRWHSTNLFRSSPYGEVLIGEANGFDSLFPAKPASTSSANGMALQIGGGVDVRISSRFDWRVVAVHWLRTTLPNGTDNVQNNVVVGSGIVFRFH